MRLQVRAAGFTLLELMLSLTVSAILLSVIVPSYKHFRARNQTTHVVNQIISAIHMARSAAMTANEVIIFCGSKDQQHCDGSWSQGQLIMEEQSQQILHFYSEEMPNGDHLWWRSSLSNNNLLKLSPAGFTQGQRGSFYYCPQYNSSEYGAKIVVSDSARIRIEYGGKECENMFIKKLGENNAVNFARSSWRRQRHSSAIYF